MPDSTGYGKNYHLYSDTLLPTRLQQILDLATAYPDQAKFVGIITWNDWTESSLVSTYKGGDNAADGNQYWSKNDPHQGFMSLMGPYLRAFKNGEPEVTVQSNEVGLVYWYRPTLKGAS
jgi:glucan endo-1,3-alpha-glucosidase